MLEGNVSSCGQCLKLVDLSVSKNPVNYRGHDKCDSCATNRETCIRTVKALRYKPLQCDACLFNNRRCANLQGKGAKTKSQPVGQDRPAHMRMLKGTPAGGSSSTEPQPPQQGDIDMQRENENLLKENERLQVELNKAKFDYEKAAEATQRAIRSALMHRQHRSLML